MKRVVTTLVLLLLVPTVDPFGIRPVTVTCRPRVMVAHRPPQGRVTLSTTRTTGVLFYKYSHDKEESLWKALHHLHKPRSRKTIFQRLVSFFHRPEHLPRTTGHATVEGAGSLRPSTTTLANWQAPEGPRWAMAAPHVNLTGVWKPVITPSFQKEYDTYLQRCGASWIFSNLAKSVCGLVTEVITHDGTSLTISGTTPVGAWKRTLLSTGAVSAGTANLNKDGRTYQAMNVTVVDPDGDTVVIESCWQQEGHTHVSWLRDKPRARGGVIESRRSLDDKGYLLCQSLFHPADGSPPNFQEASVTWKFAKIDD